MTSVESDVDLKDYVKDKLPEDRWSHTQGVRSTAETLCEFYELPQSRLDRTALVHDVGRGVSLKQQRTLAVDYRQGLDAIERDESKLWHAPAGAQLLVETFDFDRNDPLVDAVAKHTTGSPNPSYLLMALLVADFVEPNRPYPEADRLREQIGTVPLKSLARQVLQQKIEFVMTDGQHIHPRSLETYNSLCD